MFQCDHANLARPGFGVLGNNDSRGGRRCDFNAAFAVAEPDDFVFDLHFRAFGATDRTIGRRAVADGCVCRRAFVCGLAGAGLFQHGNRRRHEAVFTMGLCLLRGSLRRSVLLRRSLVLVATIRRTRFGVAIGKVGNLPFIRVNQCVREEGVNIFHDFVASGRDVKIDVGMFFEFSAVETGESENRRTVSASVLGRLDDIRRVAAGGNQNNQVAVVHQIAELPFKNGFVAAIVSQSGDRRGIGAKRQNSRRFVVGTGDILSEIRRQMNGECRAAAVACGKDLLVLRVCLADQFNRFR